MYCAGFRPGFDRLVKAATYAFNAATGGKLWKMQEDLTRQGNLPAIEDFFAEQFSGSSSYAFKSNAEIAANFDKLPGSNKFQCWLCKGRGFTDKAGHSNGKTHKSKVKGAEEAQRKRNIRVAGLTAEDRRMVADDVGWDALADDIHVPDAGPANEIDEANEVDMTAWLQAASPTGNESDKEDLRPFNWQNFLAPPHDDDHNSINSEEDDEEIEEIPLALENDDDEEVNKWYPFEKKEVINSLSLP
ncbi:uncharacterized protein MELLADRAFT_106886 [Melampsora larici-populina 98AG31]|uniref:Uncharacterized protein n=1 Tax=Melampsora larici-populina (strain 98AG31 / pathotype 3-4-7) TaxID=747676 RepID=F4RMZ1_MELLP|nr:uncharacterized protein MELLADRAFT_106886 [Melampsora larici-populina 98AG31]EGG06202.1 hypothetical protein MELLADRAFT_106886 [Melampsora larici-populina 98AG31]